MSHSLTDKFKLSFRLGGSRGGEKMPSKKQYNLVQNDDYDTRVPLHSEEAFHHGIVFQAKYIGTLDVPRPTSRVEIVAAMRRIRYEFKAKGVKKKKVTVEISVDGVKVTLRKKKKKKETKWSDAEGDSQELMQHPIYRIFYVSHDSSDLKIFSYIARDGVNNVFKCNVFKSNKKSQAMRIVRTVGQAFEVCHKLSPEPQPAAPSNSAACDLSQEAALSISDRASDVSEKSKKVGAATSPNIFEPETADLLPIELTQKILQFEPFVLKPHNDVEPSVNVDPHQYNQEVPAPDGHLTLAGNASPCIASPQSAEHREKFLAESLAQQRQQTRAATAQLAMLNDQLVVEKAARMEAQARTHQLLLHNKELIDHISMLVAHLQDRERGGTGLQTGHFSTMPQWEGAGRGKQSATATATLNNNNEPPLKPPQPTQPAPNVLRTTADITLHARPTQNTEEKNANDLSSILLDLSNAHTNYRKMNTKTNEKSSYFSSADEIISDSVRSIQDLLQNNDSFENAYALRPHNEIEDNRFSVVADVERENECQYIRPLSQIGTITTLDEEGRVRIVVPTKKNPQPIISRTTSERVPNKSVLMSQLREQWGRHTTK